MRPTAVLLLLLLLTTGCARTLTNVVGEQRTCLVPADLTSTVICSGREGCGIAAALVGLVALAALAAYGACIHQAHEEGFE